MISMTLADWLVLTAIPIIAAILAIFGRSQNKGWRGYFIAQGTLSTTSVVSTYFGANLTFTTIFLLLAHEAYYRGACVFVVPVFWFLGSCLFSILYNHIQPYVAKGQMLHQALAEGFASPQLQKWASCWTIIGFTGTVGLEFYGAMLVFHWLGLPSGYDVTLGLVLAACCAAFTYIGGFRGVAISDFFLDIFALAAAIIIGYLAYPRDGLSVVPAELVGSPPPLPDITESVLYALGMALLFIPFHFCVLDSWQRCAAWHKKEKSIASWTISGGALLAICYSAPIFVGLWLRRHNIEIAHSDQPLRVFLSLQQLPAPLTGIIIAGFIGAMLSTADELLNCSALTVVFDLLQVPRDHTTRSATDERRIVVTGQLYTVFFGFLSAFVAILAIWLKRPISDIAIAVFSGQVVFFLPLCLQFFWPEKAKALGSTASLAMVLAFVTGLAAVVSSWVWNIRLLAESAPLLSFFTVLVVLCIGLLRSVYIAR